MTDKLFTGHQRETANGIYHFQARLYNNDVGRFPQADTLAGAGPAALNRYAYVNNNPATLTDPTGHWIGGPGGAFNPSGGWGGSSEGSLEDDVFPFDVVIQPASGQTVKFKYCDASRAITGARPTGVDGEVRITYQYFVNCHEYIPNWYASLAIYSYSLGDVSTRWARSKSGPCNASACIASGSTIVQGDKTYRLRGCIWGGGHHRTHGIRDAINPLPLPQHVVVREKRWSVS